MNSIRYWLARYLMNEKKVNIVEDVSFGSSNKVFSALLVELKRNDMAKVNHAPSRNYEGRLTKAVLKLRFKHF